MTIDTTNRRHWRDVEAAAKTLEQRPADRRTLLLLATLPLLSEEVFQRLAGLRGGASVYRGLRRLADDSLIAAVRPSLQAGHGPCRWYRTDLGSPSSPSIRASSPSRWPGATACARVDLLALLPGLP